MNVARILEERRLRAEETRDRLLEEIRAKAPAFEENETQIREIGFALIRAAMHGTDASELSREMEDAKKRRLQILKDAGYDETALTPPYTCPMCEDTGVRDGKICDCKRALILASRFHDHELSRKLEVENFETYDLSLYEDGGVGSPGDHARTGELRQCEHGDLEFFCKRLEAARNGTDLLLSVFVAPVGRHKL